MSFLLFLIVSLFLAPVQESPHTLTIQVSGLNPLKGDLYLSLHNRPEFFNEPDSALMKRKITVKAETAAVVFEKVPAGRYALAVYHDENLNGIMDTNEKGLPVEGYGFSTKNKVLGKPKFDQAAFELHQDEALTVNMIYLAAAQKKNNKP